MVQLHGADVQHVDRQLSLIVFGYVALVFALGGQPQLAGRLVTGSVLDPGGLPVVAAAVRVICSSSSDSATTDARGRFEIHLPAGTETRCRVEVARDGFARFERTFDRSHAPSLLVRLQLQPHEERVTVRADATGLRAPRAGILGGDLLRELFTDADGMLDYARALAGARNDRARIVVDGVAGRALPPASRIDRVLVNVDPYSASLSGLDGARIEVETAPLRDAWSYGANLSPGSVAGRHPLGADRQSQTRTAVVHVAGPLPWRTAAFSAGARHTRREHEPPLLTRHPWDQTTAGTASRGDRATSAFAAAEYRASATRVSIDLAVSEARREASGAGGLVMPDAALDGSSRTLDAHAAFRRQAGTVAFKTTATVAILTDTSAARSVEQGVSVHGVAAGGGAAVLSDRTHAVESRLTAALEGRVAGRSFRAGLDAIAGRAAETWLPNPRGVLFLAPDGERATPIIVEVDRGGGRADAHTRGGAMYAELHWWQTPIVTFTSGFRVDVTSADGPAFQPRMSAAARVAGGTLAAGAGRFVDDWTARTLLPLHARAATTIEHTAFDGACAAASGPASCTPLRGSVDVSVARQRQALASISFSRPIRAAELAGEYRWSASEDVASFLRALTPGGWLERFASAGRQRAHELRVRASLTRRASTLTAHYAWRRMRDTADGWYGAPTSEAALEQWAPASGIVPHEGGFVWSVRTRRTSVSLLGSYLDGSPLDVVFSPRTIAEALTQPRRPGVRNGGHGPSSATVSVFASRAMRVPLTHVQGRLGAQVLNVTGRRNLVAPVTVIDSPLYGRATDAGVGRILSVWFSLTGS